ncbi:unnamed protein product [Rangifer tarandus platyrhynchus]|uniref:Uncharacterized protein n=2 Tax=Rangifer tarandus platyrhynchus TaxID=3082113 RepID=A0ABN8ZHS9_RANTA|nr:unnamed protein product [Rangifer tarandus platyrhynchus]
MPGISLWGCLWAVVGETDKCLPQAPGSSLLLPQLMGGPALALAERSHLPPTPPSASPTFSLGPIKSQGGRNPELSDLDFTFLNLNSRIYKMKAVIKRISMERL